MAEPKPLRKESPFGKEWIMYGKDPGLKTADLIEFQKLITPMGGVKPLPGLSIGASYFDEFLSLNKLEKDIQRSDIDRGKIPKSLLGVNKEILEVMPKGKPVVVRSSARDERGGTGVYYSGFFVPTGNIDKDQKKLEELETEVYSSYYSHQAKVYRDNSDVEGMGILIQPVVGDRYDDQYFMPSLSGVMTLIDGEPTLRLVGGLGTKAVDMDEAIVLKGEDITLENITKSVSKLKSTDAINIYSGQVESIPLDALKREKMLGQLGKLSGLFEAWQSIQPPHYWEFAIDQSDQPPFIVQAAPEPPTKQPLLEYEQQEGKTIFEGTDTVNTGIKRGRGIIVVGVDGYIEDDLHFIEAVNSQERDFLIVFPEVAFSKLGKGARLSLRSDQFFRIEESKRVDLSHFSHALGVVEIQIPVNPMAGNDGSLTFTIDHTGGRGGAHFTELCKRRDILFLGVEQQNETNEVFQLGEMTEKIGMSSGFYDVDFKITNTKGKGRVEIMNDPKQRKYKYKDLGDWSDEFWRFGSDLSSGPTEDQSIGIAFLDLLDCFSDARRESLINFDPFKFIEKLPKDKVTKILSSIEVVLENIWMLNSYDEWQQFSQYYEAGEEFPIEAYIQELKNKLTEQTK